jgi:hypothetical protein
MTITNIHNTMEVLSCNTKHLHQPTHKRTGGPHPETYTATKLYCIVSSIINMSYVSVVCSQHLLVIS